VLLQVLQGPLLVLLLVLQEPLLVLQELLLSRVYLAYCFL
jgi:hypothetical protein